MGETMENVNEAPAASTQPFTAEVGRVLEIVINSLYKEREIFLRELISNASDACDKLRYEAIAEPSLLAGDAELKITIAPDAKAGTIAITDTGIGMDRQDLIDNLGTIARSGTARFLEAAGQAGKADLRLIGQFGVGFYAAFMVADKVSVTTRKAGTTTGHLWESDGKTGYTISPLETEVPRGTRIVLHLKEDAKEFLDSWKIRGIIRTYSDHIAVPILLEEQKESKEEPSETEKGPEQINEGSALWTRPRSEISEEQYREFYHHVAHSFDEPFARVHFTAEGTLAYTGLLFVPSQKPFDLYDPKRRHGVKLYVKRVFITDDLAELLPRYLRFVSGIVDSEDLQLNVSRETLQHGPVVTRMRKVLTKRVIDELGKKAALTASENAATPTEGEEKAEQTETVSYESWWTDFGAILKEGLYEDQENRKKLLELARFKSTHGSGLTTLEQYVQRMKEGQESIFYISGESAEALRTHPQLEEANAKGVEVLLMDDPVDEFWLGEVNEYEGKSFKSLTKGEADLSKVAESEPEKKEEEATPGEDLDRLVARLKLGLGEAVKDVRISKRLRDSAVCLVAEEHGLDMRLERLLKQHRELGALGGRILEINPRHDLVRRMAELAKDEARQAELDELGKLLLDQARIIEGEPIPDVGAFSRRMSTYLARGLAA
ncbi:molecular chaperone HtpG [Arboricoccus pini]|uniref:Chaperone protein HtpG n=1 Tax=Arboricoccus pini TaxID=1963835 RepID=A0A212RTJ2_9PROT|nr:molecular chaperone HtpG [Arboricoccus pini]SNB75833.1 molecular chaperone HtpG [Arboricoccus pini]